MLINFGRGCLWMIHEDLVISSWDSSSKKAQKTSAKFCKTIGQIEELRISNQNQVQVR